MSPQHQAHQAYHQAFHTVGKTRQVVMLYDGMIRFLKQAREAIAEKRIEDRFNLLVKASDVVLGLQASLDFEHGGQVARVLYDFYSSVDSRILTIQRTNDLGLCDELITELKEMREAWNVIDHDESVQGGQVAQPTAQMAVPSHYQPEDGIASATGTQPQMPFPSDITV